MCKIRKINKNREEKNINMSFTELKYARGDHNVMTKSHIGLQNIEGNGKHGLGVLSKQLIGHSRQMCRTLSDP